MALEIKERQGSEKALMLDTNEIIILNGLTGSGKTTTLGKLVYNYYKRNYKIVYVTEKPKSPMENCFMVLPPEADWHKTDLIKQRFKDITGKPYEVMPIEIYHPFLFSDKIKKTTKFPQEFKFFSFDITDLTDDDFAIILSLPTSSNSVEDCMETLNHQKKDLDIFSFAFNYEHHKKSQQLKISNLGMPIDIEYSKDSQKRMRRSLAQFSDNFFLQPHNFKYNLEMISILNNNKVTFFTYKYLQSDKLRFFTQTHLLSLIDNAISTDEVNRPVLLVLEEIKILLPKSISDRESWEAKLSDKLRKMLAGLRNQGKGVTVIATTQSYYETSKDFKTAVSDTITMKMNLDDIKSFKRDFNISESNNFILRTNQRGEAVLLNDALDRDIPASKIKVQLPPFGLKIEGSTHFFKKYKEVYPERMESRKEVIDYFEEERKKQFEKQKERVNSLKKEEKEVKKTKPVVQTIVIENEDKAFYQCYQLMKSNPKSPDTELSKTIGLNKTTLRKNAIRYALEIKDWEFIDNVATKKFVALRMKDVYNQIFNAPRI